MAENLTEILQTETEEKSNGSGPVEETQASEQDLRAIRRERLRRFKENAAENPDSVFVFPFGSLKGGMVFPLTALERVLNNIKRNAVFIVPIEVVRECMQKVEDLSEEIWAVVKKYVPALYDFDRRNWRRLNDSIDEKRILAKRRNTFCILPRTEEIGQIAVAIKVIHKASIEYQQTNLEEYENLIKEYTAITKKVSKMADEFSKILNKHRKQKMSA